MCLAAESGALDGGADCPGPSKCRFIAKYRQDHPKNVVLGIKGGWYDVTSFVPYHPGGSYIARLNGRDCTQLVDVFHDSNVLANRKPVGYYTRDLSDRAAVIFEELHTQLRYKGFFETNYQWYAVKMTIPWLILAAFGLILRHMNGRMARGAVFGELSVTLELIFAGVILGNFWQQCGFLMHDLMHNECFHNRKWDQLFGQLFGTVCTGIGSYWWRDEHFEHHVFTNVFCEDTLYYDPQMREDVWIQNDILKPTFVHDGKFLTTVQWLLFKLQHITFAPLCMIFGRIGIVANALGLERRWYEWVAHATHWIWTMSMLFGMLDKKCVLVVYGTAMLYEGVLHLQLVVSHYAKPWLAMRSVATEKDWFTMQVEHCLNIVNPPYTDWFHGGLNFHIEHHMFPTMPRHNFRKASPFIRAAVEKAGLKYDEATLWQAICMTISHLHRVGSKQSLTWPEQCKKDDADDLDVMSVSTAPSPVSGSEDPPAARKRA